MISHVASSASALYGLPVPSFHASKPACTVALLRASISASVRAIACVIVVSVASRSVRTTASHRSNRPCFEPSRICLPLNIVFVLCVKSQTQALDLVLPGPQMGLLLQQGLAGIRL